MYQLHIVRNVAQIREALIQVFIREVSSERQKERYGKRLLWLIAKSRQFSLDYLSFVTLPIKLPFARTTRWVSICDSQINYSTV